MFTALALGALGFLACGMARAREPARFDVSAAFTLVPFGSTDVILGEDGQPGRPLDLSPGASLRLEFRLLPHLAIGAGASVTWLQEDAHVHGEGERRGWRFPLVARGILPLGGASELTLSAQVGPAVLEAEGGTTLGLTFGGALGYRLRLHPALSVFAEAGLRFDPLLEERARWMQALAVDAGLVLHL